MAQTVKNLPDMQEMQIRFLGGEDLLEKGMATYSMFLLGEFHGERSPLEPNMEQWTGSKLGKEYIKAVYYHFAYLTNMQSTSCEMLGWKKHKLESRSWGEIAVTSDMQMTLPLWQKVKRN